MKTFEEFNYSISYRNLLHIDDLEIGFNFISTLSGIPMTLIYYYKGKYMFSTEKKYSQIFFRSQIHNRILDSNFYRNLVIQLNMAGTKSYSIGEYSIDRFESWYISNKINEDYYSTYKKQEKEYEELFLELARLDALEIKFDLIDYKYFIFYFIGNDVIFYVDDKQNVFYCATEFFYEFDKIYSINSTDIRKTLDIFVQKYFKQKSRMNRYFTSRADKHEEDVIKNHFKYD